MVEYQVGDWVYLKLQPYRLRSLAKRPNEKLCPRFYGPYQVLTRIGQVAYQLDLPPHSRIHPVFHVSFLKKAVTPLAVPQSLPLVLADDYVLEVGPEHLLDVRRTSQGDLEVLIQWKDLPPSNNSWELAECISREFPEFHLEDKVKLHRGGNDRYSIVYKRRAKQIVETVSNITCNRPI